jgi:hypothetical protein
MLERMTITSPPQRKEHTTQAPAASSSAGECLYGMFGDLLTGSYHNGPPIQNASRSTQAEALLPGGWATQGFRLSWLRTRPAAESLRFSI